MEISNLVKITFIVHTPTAPISLGLSDLPHFFPSHDGFSADADDYGHIGDRHTLFDLDIRHFSVLPNDTRLNLWVVHYKQRRQLLRICTGERSNYYATNQIYAQ
jgi:hypothetical protein